MLSRTILCSSCGYENKESSKFCSACGLPLAQGNPVASIQPVHGSRPQPSNSDNSASEMVETRKLLEYAKQLYSEEKTKESEIAFNQVIASGRYMAEAFYGLGLVCMSLGDLKGASSQFNYSLQHDPQYANALYQLGVIAEKERSWEEARSFYNRVLAIDSGHVSAKKRLEQIPMQPAPDALNTNDNWAPPVTDAAPLQQYGVYAFLLQDPSPLSKHSLEMIDKTRMSVHPLATAFLGRLLGISLVILLVGFGATIIGSGSWAGILNEIATFPLSHITPYAGIVAILMCLFVMIIGYVYILSMKITIDKGRLQIAKGLLSRQVLNIELWRVENIELHRNFINRLTGDGTLMIQLVHQKKQIKLTGLARGPRLEDIRQQLLNLVWLLRSNAAVKGIIS